MSAKSNVPIITNMHSGRLQFTNKVLVAVLVTAVAVLVVARLVASGDVSLTVWGDRDLWRALSVPDSWPLFGPESNGGTRSPGGAFYLLLAAILAVGRNVVAVNIGVVLLFAASVLLIGVFFAHRISSLAGALIAAALAGSVTLGHALGVWNPGFILIFATAATVFGYAFLADGRALHLGLATAALAIGMQIHLQIAQVALGLILATVIYRPRLTWRHAVAVVLGLALPYLPNILSGNARLLQTAASLPGDAINNYVFWEVARLWPKAELFADLFGGAAAEFADRGPWVRVPLLAGDLLALLLAAGAAIATVRSPRKAFDGAPVGLFLLILLVTAMTALVSDLLARHMVAVTPAAAALVGLAAERLVVGLSRRGPVAQAGAAVLCGLFALRPLLAGIAGFAPVPFQLGSVAAQSEIAVTLKPAFYADRDGFEAHVAEFLLVAPHRWLVASNGIPNHMSFLYQALPATNAGANREDCLAVVAKTDADGDLRNGLTASPSLAGLDAIFGELAAESAHFLYFPYTTRDGNCLKTFPNGYIPTAFEAAHLAADAPAAAKVMDGEVVFAVSQPGHRDPIGIEIRREGPGYVAVLHGRLLRGYTGLYFRSIIAPVLCFAGEQRVHPVRFGTVTVGSPQRAALAPWRSPTFPLPDGRYRVWLIGSDGRQPIAIRDVLGELSVPAMDAAAPSLGTLQPPPAECFGNDRPAIRGADR
jgi:hypothetical protein